ncbi:MAG: hypothetical protein IAE80_00205, partial [Anaerolinea sp.]|nr:hypothetical protein [Anaerolinea sp.]
AARMTDYKGERELQIEWIDWRLTEGAVEVAGLPFEIIDRRSETALTLDQLRAEHPDLQIYGEPEYSRWSLTRGSTLAIWTIPPSPVELAAAVKIVEPAKVYLFAHDPGLDDIEKFVRRFVGLLKHVLTAKGGIAHVPTLAALMAQRESTIRVAFEWVASMGLIRITGYEGENVTIAGAGVNGTAEQALTNRVTTLLDEAAAYRAHYRRADAINLF